MSKSVQMSESFAMGVILAVAGGFMDAYSYICRGGVFANAVTGNIVLFGINIARFDWSKALHYLIPITAYAIGVVITELIRMKRDRQGVVHWRQISLAFEIAAIVVAAFLPQSLNLLANSLISLTCGTQVATFSKFHGAAMATTMCTGNLRIGTQNLCRYISSRDKTSLGKVSVYYGCIAVFIVGAMLGKVCIDAVGDKAILAAAAIQFIGLILMFNDKEVSL